MKSYVIHLIRNMPCEGNLEGRYIGRTESPLALESIAKLAQRKRELEYPPGPGLFRQPLHPVRGHFEDPLPPG